MPLVLLISKYTDYELEIRFHTTILLGIEFTMSGRCVRTWQRKFMHVIKLSVDFNKIIKLL